MARPRGGPGGLDLNAMMKQAQQMQAEMNEAQEGLKDEVVDASAGGGMVKVKMSGDMRLLEISIDPEAIDPEDPELLQDMVHGGRQRGDPSGAGACLEPPRRHHGRARRTRRGRPRRPRPARACSGARCTRSRSSG